MAKNTKRSMEERDAIAAQLRAEMEAAGGTPADECPTFLLRADQKGHLRALMAALQELPEHEAAQGLRTLREFDLWEETHR
jgi:hypothetical protein